VLLAEGDARAALADLRRASSAWRALDAPYQVARVRVLLGLALRELRDTGGADIEFDGACHLFEELGARPDLERASRLAGTASPEAPGGLSPREREVIVLLAEGRSNRAIATELYISEKTVARHVSNIFAKLDLSSRAEATAYAFTHGLAR
jgi:DNA-binding CsgD family transcriptional regulator